MQQGRLKSWNDEKGFGFIINPQSANDIFIHISSFKNKNNRPQVNQQIRFRLSVDKRGRERADNAEIVKEKRQNRRVLIKQSRRKKNKKISLSAIFAIVFTLILIALVLLDKSPTFVILIYFVMSLLSFVLYNMDKQAAQLNYWRIKENTLHIISILGGWPGALIAQQLFRHKTKKTSFRVIFMMTLLMNLLVFCWLFTVQGQSTLSFIDINIQLTIDRIIELTTRI